MYCMCICIYIRTSLIMTRSYIPPSPPTYLPTYLQVVQYIDFVDGGDFVEGHGTHVSASIAGTLDDDWSMHACRSKQTLACTGACLSQVGMYV